jgi:malate/lactate dehydrogenase
VTRHDQFISLAGIMQDPADLGAPQCLNAFIIVVTIPVNFFVPLHVEELFRPGVTDSHRRVF